MEKIEIYTEKDFTQNIKICFERALNLCNKNSLESIKVILQNFTLIEPNNFINKVLQELSGETIEVINKSLKDHSFHLKKAKIGFCFMTPKQFFCLDGQDSIFIILNGVKSNINDTIKKLNSQAKYPIIISATYHLDDDYKKHLISNYDTKIDAEHE